MAAFFGRLAGRNWSHAAFVAATSSTLVNNAPSLQRSGCEALPKGGKHVNLRKRMTAIGKFAVDSETATNPSIITFYLRCDGVLSAQQLKDAWQSQNMPSLHPRFHQSIDANTNNTYFQPEPTTNVKEHLSETTFPKDAKELHRRLAAMQTTRWNLGESLWYANFSNSMSKDESILCFRGHHALADGASMGAALLDMTDEGPQIREEIRQALATRKKKRPSTWWERLKLTLQKLFWFMGGAIPMGWYNFKLAVLGWWESPHPWKLIHEMQADGAGSLTAQRVLGAVDVASLEEVKWVAHALSGKNDKSSKITVNDVMTSCVTAALAKLLDHQAKLYAIRQEARKEPLKPLPLSEHVNITIPVHLRGGVILPGESVGNRLGAMVARLPGQQSPTNSDKLQPTRRLELVHQELSKLKKTPVAIWSHIVASITARVLPSRWTSAMFERASAGSSCVVTNTRGPPLAVHIMGNKVQSITGFIPIPPGIPMGVVVGSYAGNVSMTVTAQPWAVPDPDLFLSWVLEEYKLLVSAAKQRKSNDQ